MAGKEETLSEKVARLKQELEVEQPKKTTKNQEKPRSIKRKPNPELEDEPECECCDGTESRGWKIFAGIIAIYIILLIVGAGTLFVFWLIKMLFGL